MALLKFIFLFFFMSLSSYAQSLNWVVKLKTQYIDEATGKKLDLYGGGTLFRYEDNGKDRWFILTVAHVTQGRSFDAYIVDSSGKSIHQFKKLASQTTRSGINEAIDHLTDVHVFEVTAPPQKMINKKDVPVCELKGVVQGQNLYRLYLQEESYQPQEDYSVAVQLTIPHLSWVRESGFTNTQDIAKRIYPFGLRFYWTEKEYAVDSRIVHGMSGLPTLTFDAKRSKWVVLGMIKSFHRQRMETYIVTDKAISSVFEALVFGKQPNLTRQNILITWRYRSPFGTYRYIETERALFSEISASNPYALMEKAGGGETADGGGGETADGGGGEKFNGVKDLNIANPFSGIGSIEWQWKNEKKLNNVGAFSLQTPDSFKGVSAKRIWVSAAIRSWEFLQFSEIFDARNELKTHPIDKQTMQLAFQDRINTTSEMYSLVNEPIYCTASWDAKSDSVKIGLRFPYHPDFAFAKNSKNSYDLKVSVNRIINQGFDVVENNLNINVQGLFFFDPIHSYASSPLLAKERVLNQLLISNVILKDVGAKTNQSLFLPCIGASEPPGPF